MGSTCSKHASDDVIVNHYGNDGGMKGNKGVESAKPSNKATPIVSTLDNSNKKKIVESMPAIDENNIPKGKMINFDNIVPPSKMTHYSSSGGNSSNSNSNGKPGWSSGASTPREDIDTSSHGSAPSSVNPKLLAHSSSILGLDKMIEAKAEQGLTNNIVHMEVPFGKPIEEVYEGVHDGPVLGSGISGLVRLCTHKATGAQYAVKCLDLGLVETDEGLHQLREEIAIMCQLDHPNIVRLEEVYESHSEIYLVQELCVGGELFDRLDEQPDYHYSEAQCARLVKQMLCAVRYIHSKGIIHRDLKLENFLFSSVDPDSELKMIDFGLSKHFQYGEVHHEAVGTPYTVAPEVIRGEYDERCDVWAIGVITYLLLSGDPPFGGCGGPESLFQVRSNILQGKFKFEPTDVWEHVSKDAKDFIRMLLITDPNKRPTAKQCQKSPWISEWINKGNGHSDSTLNPSVVKALVNFKEYSDMRKLLCEVLSFTLMPDQITDLRKEFEKLDTDGSGEISLKGLKQVLMQEAGAGSLGALGEDEVEDIFNAMRVRKTETQIHWHEFIAAGLSQCKVDERNLKLAFDRLDSDHKGYISFDNVMDLMGRDGLESEDQMKEMWSDSMKACNCKNACITYDDFLLLMKGQTRSVPKSTLPPLSKAPTSFQPLKNNLDVLHECTSISEGDTEHDHDDLSAEISPPSNVPNNRSSTASSSKDGLIPQLDVDGSLLDDYPIMIDEEEDIDQKISDSADLAMKMKQAGLQTPPQSPVFRASVRSDFSIDPLVDFSRRRSRSVDDKDLESDIESEDGTGIKFRQDIRRAMPLPEHTHDANDIEKAIHDETLTPLVVNRKLYRAHRKMRLAVLEASKRFEDEQMKRTRAELQAQQQSENKSSYGASLVMRRGHKKEVSSETIRSLMQERQKAHETIVKDAVKKSGRSRSRRGRMKTVSDMSAMMAAMNTSDSDMMPNTPDSDIVHSSMTTLQNPPGKFAPMSGVPDIILHDIAKPEPTVPGVFRKTSDPFQAMSKKMIGLFGAKNESEKTFAANKEANLTNVKSSSKHSLKISVSDGELNALDGAPNSPEDSREVGKIQGHSVDLPPPPPLLQTQEGVSTKLK